MGTAYMVTSAGFLLLEIIFQIYAVTTHSQGSEALFVILLVLVIGPLIIINSISAIQVTRTQDFSGKACGRAICIGFHSIQLGIMWRSLKLLILYESKDWLDYLSMRLFHCGFQSLPFSVILAYGMFVHDSAPAVCVLTIIISIISASVALATYRTGEKLYEANEFEEQSLKVRRIFGVLFLTLSTCLLLISRCASIVLFTVVLSYWIALPLALHFVIHVAIRIYRLKCDDGHKVSKILHVFCLSFVDIFDLVGTDYDGVKCSYVFYYTIMLIENLFMSFYWMLAAGESGERFKLMTVLIILMCFIIGIILKFASCGCIYNLESDILSDAFNNPELGEKDKEIEITNPNNETNIRLVLDAPDNNLHDIQINEAGYQTHDHGSSNTMKESDTIKVKRSNTSKQGSLSNSSTQNAHRQDYDNQAFVQSQGNISKTSHTTSSSHEISNNSQRRSRDSGIHSQNINKRSRAKRKRKSAKEPEQFDFHNNSRGSQTLSNDSHIRPHDNHKKLHDSQERVSATTETIRGLPKRSSRSQIKVSDTSKYTSVQPTPVPRVKGQTMEGNAHLVSSNSVYSRNTNTLINGSVKDYHYNGFNDPFREKRLLEIGKQYQLPGPNKKRGHRHRSIYSNLDFSLDSSELYPSISSDTSSMTSYDDSNHPYAFNKPRQRQKTRQSQYQYSRDGYSTDVSNSDNLSFTDHTMEDSSSWTESSESDGAITWPPSNTSNLLNMYNISENVSSKDTVMHWLDAMEIDSSIHDASFSTLNEPSIASDTDISLTAMQTFEVKKPEKKKFKRLIPKPKGLLLKFSSLNYKGNKQKQLHNRPYPLNTNNANVKSNAKHKAASKHGVENVALSRNPDVDGRLPLPTMPLPVDSVQESIV